MPPSLYKNAFIARFTLEQLTSPSEASHSQHNIIRTKTVISGDENNLPNRVKKVAQFTEPMLYII